MTWLKGLWRRLINNMKAEFTKLPTCPYCEEQFITVVWNKRFCTYAHRDKYHAIKKKVGWIQKLAKSKLSDHDYKIWKKVQLTK